MSVYKKNGRDTYSYDFEIRGRRFSGNTGATSKREAKRFEESQKEIERAKLAEEAKFFASTMTFEIAASRYWLEVGQHHVNSATTVANLEWLRSAIGRNTEMDSLTDSIVASLVAKRRGERVRRTGKNGKLHLGKLVEPSTVNRTCTQPLREIYLRARDVWKIKVSDVDFGKHMLDERQERIREASPDEEDAILSELSRGYDIAVRFAFLSGCRRMEILGLEWSMVDFFTRNFRVIGKGNKERVIPMSEEIYTLLWAEKDHHQTSVFTFVAARTRKKEGLERGKRYPLTESGLKTAMRRAVPKAGVADFRFHDTRHTAATRVLRKSNLRVAQLLLGHSDVKTTTKYAHALNDDIRAALDAASRPTKNPTGGNLSEDKHLAEKGNPK
ncbi:site-specific recombinase XerD [Shinella sp. DD12]|nr:site-specific recombinase XerD [Shinella sp. DD12]